MGGNCILLFLWVTMAFFARIAEATQAKGEQMLAVCLIQWERCCLEWLVSELSLVCFCSFFQQAANKNHQQPRKQNTTYWASASIRQMFKKHNSGFQLWGPEFLQETSFQKCSALPHFLIDWFGHPST